ncbi:lachrymatory-factor synthase [Trifolium pratense]|uniref:Lachrymatory-factor synthase n=2 Tax=Trifolium pratense TaxID=57577 RepID=A0A2K3KIA5_TRIPR|nr:lachrymatory-factor synthase-like [Trifolium pratense]PNX65999.1 lachrymatory-factor synthase [Trifolium pratense]
MGNESQPNWEDKVTIKLPNITSQQVWQVLQDFCNLHKWIPIDTCYQLEGIQNQPGVIRYCASTIKSPDSEPTIKWAKEKLLTIDPIKRCLSYEIVDNNMGFKSYVATLKVVPINDDDEGAGCVVEWGFVCDPVEGWTLQDFKSYIEYCLQFMAKKIEVESSSSSVTG